MQSEPLGGPEAEAESESDREWDGKYSPDQQVSRGLAVLVLYVWPLWSRYGQEAVIAG